jgi:hypothetical protein
MSSPAPQSASTVLHHRLTVIVTVEAVRQVRKLIGRAIHDLRVPLDSIRQEPILASPCRYQLSGEFPGSPELAQRLMRLLLAHLPLPCLVVARLETLGEAARTGGRECAPLSRPSPRTRECRDLLD